MSLHFLTSIIFLQCNLRYVYHYFLGLVLCCISNIYYKLIVRTLTLVSWNYSGLVFTLIYTFLEKH